jgi:hypothetical protein
MEMVEKSIPSPDSINLVKRIQEGRKRVEKDEQPIQEAIATYKTALAEYERLAQTESPSYSVLEIPKLKVADAFLESRGIATGLRKAEKVV